MRSEFSVKKIISQKNENTSKHKQHLDNVPGVNVSKRLLIGNFVR